ncbi:amidase family protein [Bradyrhizobium sp. CIAT3101]|uniref:amidase family protein n=1 Tax=Bradyrhizobium sp. CIAT3101 TaxID=439387 RepID=UPI0024B0E30B|nr:amidase family protein [Bradyrhizobium sp. CIAT3101]WFU78204.1 amidase family protein [Bradyrhizobium sp. CIAT3101]
MPKLSRKALATEVGSVFLWGLSALTAATAADTEHSIADMSGRAIVTHVAAGRLDPCRVAESLLSAIGNDGHNAFISTRRADDLDVCKDPHRLQDLRARALAGLPIAVKDNVLVGGQRATFGTSATRNYVPTETADTVQRLIDQGAVILGKLNLHELAGGVTSNNAVFGPVRNAYDPKCFAGGSSGGAGAAVGARLVPIALGTDTGGSVLIPAALNGVIGFRPTVGRYPMAGVLPVSPTRDTIGPIARTVEDIILVDSVMASTNAAVSPSNLSGLRIGVPRKLFVDVADADSRALFENTLQRLREAGAEVVEIDLPGLVQAEKGFGPITPYELKTEVPKFLARYHVGISFDELVAGIRSPDLIKDYQTRIVGPASPSDAAYMEAVQTFKPAVQGAFQKAFAEHRLFALAFPTTLTDARPIEGSDDQITMDGAPIPTWKAYIDNTNYLTKGLLAAMTLPMGLSSRGLPLGVTFAVLPRHDEELLSLGLSVQQLLPTLPAPPKAADRPR